MRLLLLPLAALIAFPAAAQVRVLPDRPESRDAARDGVEVYFVNEGDAAATLESPDRIRVIAADASEVELSRTDTAIVEVFGLFEHHRGRWLLFCQQISDRAHFLIAAHRLRHANQFANIVHRLEPLAQVLNWFVSRLCAFGGRIVHGPLLPAFVCCWRSLAPHGKERNHVGKTVTGG